MPPRKEPPLCALLLVGGHSKRMNTDKALLRYGGRPQVERAFEILSNFCECTTFLSIRDAQGGRPPYSQFPQVLDSCGDIGPLGGILSALRACPGAPWLVLACDLPFVTTATLSRLIGHRQPSRLATAFLSAHDGKPEPLCAIYEPRIRPELLRLAETGMTCPRRALMQLDVELIEPVDPRALDNINTPAEYEAAQKEIPPR